MKYKEFVDELRIAYYRHKKAKGISLIDKAFQQAYNGNSAVLISLLKKLIPDLASTEMTGDSMVDQSKHIYINYKVTDGHSAPPQPNDRISRSGEVPGTQCGPPLGENDTRG